LYFRNVIKCYRFYTSADFGSFRALMAGEGRLVFDRKGKEI
jgi:hypothetical protein